MRSCCDIDLPRWHARVEINDTICSQYLRCSAGHTFGWAFFLPYITQDLRLMPTTVSVLWMLALWVSALCLPWIGRLVEEKGQRKVGMIVMTFAYDCSRYAQACFRAALDSRDSVQSTNLWASLVYIILKLLTGFEIICFYVLIFHRFCGCDDTQEVFRSIWNGIYTCRVFLDSCHWAWRNPYLRHHHAEQV